MNFVDLTLKRYLPTYVCMGIRWQITFSKIDFAQFMNRNVKILSRRLYSPSLKDVAWLERARAQVIVLTFHTFICKFS